MAKFGIYSFKSGINQSFDDSLIKNYEASEAKNCDISRGTLRTKRTPKSLKSVGSKELLAYYTGAVGTLLYSAGGAIKKFNGDTNIITGRASDKADYVNFYYKDKDVMIFSNGTDNVKYYDGSAVKDLKNRRPVYNEDTGALTGYVDADGKAKTTEAEVTTLAPKGKFIELHYDRLWIGGIEAEPDRIYFSTSGRNGADIEDFTFPIEENEANMHGGFIDFSSYDGGRVIGLKVIGDDICVFKEKTMFRIFGTDPSSYTKVQIFSSNGAISNKSIVTGGNSCYFLNHNNIYMFDGVNVTPIGNKIYTTLQRLNKAYVSEACGIFYDDKYYLAVPLDSSTKNNCLIELDTQTGCYMIYDIAVNSFIEFDRKLYFSNDTGIYSFGEAGTGILPLLWESPSIEIDKNIRKIFDYFYAVCNGQCKVSLITERGTKELIFDGSKIRKKLKNKGKTFKIKIESTGVPFELSTPEWFYEEDID